MAQDLREMLKKHKEEEVYHLKENHENRFLQRLNEELPQEKKNSLLWLKIAASVLVLISVAFYVTNNSSVPPNTTVVEKGDSDESSKISLGDLSPDLKKVENYYVANINIQLSDLEISAENKNMVDSFMARMEDLNIEYKKLNIELNEEGPNDQTISALIKNLQLRLQLLQKLKSKLNQLKSSKNEQITTNTI